jgi:hypothetical protein
VRSCAGTFFVCVQAHGAWRMAMRSVASRLCERARVHKFVSVSLAACMHGITSAATVRPIHAAASRSAGRSYGADAEQARVALFVALPCLTLQALPGRSAALRARVST